jgi:hypothetical protein
VGRARLATLMMALSLGVTAPPSQAGPPNVPVTAADLHAYQQPSLSVDPEDGSRLAVAYQDGNQLQTCGVSVSTDGGFSWTPRTVVGPGGAFPLPRGDTICWNPVLSFGPSHILFYLFQASESDFSSRLYLSRSTDEGTTFSAPQPIEGAPARSAGGQWDPALAVEQATGRVYASWEEFGPGPTFRSSVWVASSTDGGRTFTRGVPVESSGPIDASNPQLALAPDGRLFVAWIDTAAWSRGCFSPRRRCGAPGRLFVSTSTDHGRTFTGPVLVDTRLHLGCTSSRRPHCDDVHFTGVSGLLTIAATSAAGGVVVAWFEPVGGRNRVLVARSADGGRTWTAPRATGAGPGRRDDQQFRPQLSVAPNGRLDLAWYDRSVGRQDVYVASSSDGGRTFGVPGRVSDRSSDPGLGPPDLYFGDAARISFGEHLGAASTDDSVLVAWTDTRRGSRSNAKQDVYFASIRVPDDGRGSVGAVPWVAAAVIVAGAGLWIVGRRLRRRGRAAPGLPG